MTKSEQLTEEEKLFPQPRVTGSGGSYPHFNPRSALGLCRGPAGVAWAPPSPGEVDMLSCASTEGLHRA